MRGRAQRKVVTSGRLTGAVRGGLATLNPGTTPCPGPAYSLYSTDSEDQVISLHKGLDRCAALLSGILQADKAVSPKLHRTGSSGAVKSRLSTSAGKKSLKKVPPKAGQRGSDSRAPRGYPSARPAPHSGVKLHPPQKQYPTQLQSRLLSTHNQTPQLLPHAVSPTRTSTPPPQHEASILLSVRQSSSLSSHQTACRPDSETPHATCDGAQEFVPVRDTNAQSARTHTHAHRDSCSMKMAHLQLEPGQAEEVPEESNTEAKTKAHKLQYLFAQLKALIAGQGSVAESLLSHLEQTVSTPQMNISASNTQSVSGLHRCVRILNQQPETERHQNQAILLQRLQEELAAAQSRLQELQDDLTDLRKTLQDTQSQLRDQEAETALVKMELEASKCRLLDSEREKSKLDSLAQQRLKEMECLKSLLSSDYPAFVDSSVSDTSQPAPPTDHITQYPKSLSQMVPVQYVDVERDVDPASHLDIAAQRREEPAGTQHKSNRERSTSPGEAPWPGDARRQLFNSTLSQCETESVWSDFTFDTRDEVAFRDGLAALDASIASLQKTIKLDLRR